MAVQQARSAAIVVDRLGINHHIDFGSEPALPIAIKAVNYLGIKHVRDCADNVNTLGATGTWQQFADATGARFCAFMTEGGVNAMTRDLPWTVQLIGQGIIEFIEGGNEEDNRYATDLGNSIQITQTFQQQQIYPAGVAAGVPVVNMSFGSGWTATNNWHGDYDKVGDMSPWCDYGNAHTYPVVGRSTSGAMRDLRNDALLAASRRPVIHTELGWNNSQFKNFADIGRFAAQGLFDCIRDGDFRIYYYAIFDDGAGIFGFFNSDGTPRPAAVAIHNITTIMADNGPPRTDTLNYTASGTSTNDSILLFQRSNGNFIFAIWNESADVSHPVTITLDAAVSWLLYDPTISATGSALPDGIAGTAWIGNRPMLLEAAATVPAVLQTPLSVSLIPASASLDDQTPVGTAGPVVTVLTSDRLPFTGALAMDPPYAIVNGQPVLASPLPTGPATINPVVTATGGGVSASIAFPLTLTHFVPPPPQTPTGVTLSVSSVTLPDTTPIGTVVASFTVPTSDGLPFTGITTVTAPFGISGSNVIVASALPTGPLTLVPVVTATGNGVSASASLTVADTHTVVAPVWNPQWVTPASLTAKVGVPLGSLGISITDPLADGHAGTMALNLHVLHGTLSAKNATGALLPGSGTAKLSTYAGSFAQTNAVLATLTYTSAVGGSDTLTLDIYDQGGHRAVKNLAITVTP